MAETSKIEWTDATWNPIRARNLQETTQNDGTGLRRVGWHCEHASPGCINCYAEGFNKRLGTGLPFKPDQRDLVEIFLDKKMLTAPLRWRRPRMIFVCSMTDLFADFVPDAWIDMVFAVMALAPRHTFQVLTKRPARMRAYLSSGRAHAVGLAALEQTIVSFSDIPAVGSGVILQGDIAHLAVWPLPNVWLGTSVEDQRRADERIPALLETPAAVRFLSVEPMLEGFSLIQVPSSQGTRYRWQNPYLNGLQWVICGGESGPRARDMDADWAWRLRDECAAFGVPFFMKQMARKAPIPPDLQVQQWPRVRA